MLFTKSTSGRFWRSYRKKSIFFIFTVACEVSSCRYWSQVQCIADPYIFFSNHVTTKCTWWKPRPGNSFLKFLSISLSVSTCIVCLFPLTHGHETDKWQWWRRPSPCAPPSCPPRACAQAAASPWFWWTQSPFPEHSEIRCWPKNASQHQTLVHSTPMFIFSTEKEKCEPRKPLNEDGNLNFAIEQLLLFCQSVPHTEVSVSKMMTRWSPY